MKRLLGHCYLWLRGWKLAGQKPSEAKYLILAAPHTSNWDVPLMLSMAWIYGIRVRWIGKHTLFKWPLGPLMRWLGGVPVDRRARHNAVEQMVDEFNRRDELALLITPEGTRSRAEYWKSGFYHIARSANVPIVLGLLDFKNRVGGLFDVMHPTGDLKADMDRIRAFYHADQAKFPADFGPVRLKEETPAAGAANLQADARSADAVGTLGETETAAD
jgi:1-acyl-sn-glycerol-3-phosphate acyltransferase